MWSIKWLENHCKCSFSHVACVIFYDILDLAAINGHISYKLVTGSNVSRRGFFIGYSKSFVRDLLTMEKLAHINPVALTAACRKAIKESTAKTKLHQQTRETCSTCSKFVCGKCIGKQEKLISCKICCQ